MKEAELEQLLIKHFLLVREHEESSGLTASVNKVSRNLPSQSTRFPAVAAAVLDWKLELAWPPLGLLTACALAGLALGVFGPVPERQGPSHLTAIAYAMPSADFPTDPE
jgi:hypothetical protein